MIGWQQRALRRQRQCGECHACWEEFASATDKVAGVHLPVKQRREMEVLALTVETVVHHLNRRNVVTKEQFLKGTVRLSCTQRGICGK